MCVSEVVPPALAPVAGATGATRLLFRKLPFQKMSKLPNLESALVPEPLLAAGEFWCLTHRCHAILWNAWVHAGRRAPPGRI